MIRPEMDVPPEEFRAVCWRCRRPESACYCSRLPKLESRTHVVFLQHPRERYVAIGTARMAHLALPNSELHLGTDFGDHPALTQLLAGGEAALLFPAEGAAELATLERKPKVLVIIDGTWPLARKLLKLNPVLQALPKVRFTPSRPGNYRIRKEPDEQSVSTIEAVVEALGHLEGDESRFLPMLSAFDWMVDLQIERKAGRTSPPRKKIRGRTWPRASPVPAELVERAGDVVLFYGEANAHPRTTEPWIPAELVHLVAERPASGERLELLLAPRRELAANTPHHLGLAEADLRAGLSVPEALARLRAFLRPTDLLAVWGPFTLDLLRDEGEPDRPSLDLRRVAARVLKGRPGAMDKVATGFGAPPAQPWARGRAGQRLADLGRVASALRALRPTK